jgi:hypothetical protein
VELLQGLKEDFPQDVFTAQTQTSRYNDGLWAGRPGFDSHYEQNFSLIHSVQTDSGTQSASYTMGRKVSHSHPSSAEVKNGELYLQSHMCLHNMVLN